MGLRVSGLGNLRSRVKMFPLILTVLNRAFCTPYYNPYSGLFV